MHLLPGAFQQDCEGARGRIWARMIIFADMKAEKRKKLPYKWHNILLPIAIGVGVTWWIFAEQLGDFSWGEAAGSATAPRLWMIGSVQPSPHSRLRRQCGVREDVTAPRLISLIINCLHF